MPTGLIIILAVCLLLLSMPAKHSLSYCACGGISAISETGKSSGAGDVLRAPAVAVVSGRFVVRFLLTADSMLFSKRMARLSSGSKDIALASGRLRRSPYLTRRAGL